MRNLGLMMAAAVGAVANTVPQQIHLNMGNSTRSMVVTFTTEDACSASASVMGPAAGGASCVDWVFALPTNGTNNYHRCTMSVAESTSYQYQVSCGGSSSAVLNFTSLSSDPTETKTVIVYGDAGNDAGEPVLGPLRAEAGNTAMNAFMIHNGDYAYDLQDLGGGRGDAFMNRIQSFASLMPLMPGVGNHEDNNDYADYNNRFGWSAPGSASGHWYSWDYGKMHLIIYSTEVFFYPVPALNLTVDAMLAWMQADLRAAAANRAERPWIVAMGHRPFYCSNIDGDVCAAGNWPSNPIRVALEPLFVEFGVDVVIEAHEHSYERTWPVINGTVLDTSYMNPRGPVHVITGVAGCNEALGLCLNPMLGPAGSWSAFRSWGIFTYGYGKFWAPNATHFFFEERLAIDQGALDEFVIVQNNHGPFSNRRALRGAL